MKDLHEYLAADTQDYAQGVELLKKYGDGSKLKFFDTPKPEDLHRNHLQRELNSLLHIARSTGKYKPEHDEKKADTPPPTTKGGKKQAQNTDKEPPTPPTPDKE